MPNNPLGFMVYTLVVALSLAMIVHSLGDIGKRWNKQAPVEQIAR